MKPVVFETFRKIGAHEIGNLIQREPSCFNGIVSVRKYRVTVEEVEEPKDVLIERVRKLWRETKNHHDWNPLKDEAKILGIELSHEERRAK
jgi:hypothetical protein